MRSWRGYLVFAIIVLVAAGITTAQAFASGTAGPVVTQQGEEIELEFGTPSAQQTLGGGHGQSLVFKVRVTAGQHVFALLNKTSRWVSTLSIAEGVHPPTGASSESDQGVETAIVGGGDGYCYIKVTCNTTELVNFTITAQRTMTFPTIHPGTTESMVRLRWNGDAEWYQIPASSSAQYFALLEKNSPWGSLFSIAVGHLPAPPEAGSPHHNVTSDDAVELETTASGYVYVRVESTYDGSVHFDLTPHTTGTFPTLAMGSPEANRRLEWDGDTHWYQVRLNPDEPTPVFVLVEKERAWDTALSIREGHLPGPGNGVTDADDAVEVRSSGNLYGYVRVQSRNEIGGSYDIVGHTRGTFPTLVPGQTVSGNELRWGGDAEWYQMVAPAGEPLFVLLDKWWSWDTFLSLAVDRLPDLAAHSRSMDQSLSVVPDEDCYCYVRIQSDSIWGGAFDITQHSTTTFPTLTPGMTVTDEELDWAGDCNWYQLAVAGDDTVNVNLEKLGTWFTHLAMTFGAIPQELGPGSDGDQEAVVETTSAGYCYVKVQSGHEAGGRYNITATMGKHEITIVEGPAGTPNPAASGGEVQCMVEARDTYWHTLMYAWTATDKDGQPAGSFNNPTLQHPVWTAPANTSFAEQRYEVTVTVTCAEGAETSASFEQVVHSGHAVRITRGPSGTPHPVDSGGQVQCEATARDSFGHPLTYAWTATDAQGSPAGQFDDANQQNPVWTAPENLTTEMVHYELTVMATCSEGLQAVRSCVQGVRPRPAGPRPVQYLCVNDHPNDDGTALDLVWPKSPDDGGPPVPPAGTVAPAQALPVRYDLWRKKHGEEALQLIQSFDGDGSAAYDYTDNGLLPATIYIYALTASDANGTSKPVVRWRKTVDNNADAPGPVSELSCKDRPNDQGNAVILEWNKSPDDGDGLNSVTSYNIYRRRYHGGSFMHVARVEADGSARYEYTDTTLTKRHLLQYAVQAYDGNMQSEPALGQVKGIDNLAPGNPQNFAVVSEIEDNGRALRLRWDASADDGQGAGDVEQYWLWRKASGGSLEVIAKVNATGAASYVYVDAGLAVKRKYEYFIRAWDGTNESGAEYGVGKTHDELVPQKPEVFVAGYLGTGYGVVLTWHASGDDGQGVADVVKYRVWRRLMGGAAVREDLKLLVEVPATGAASYTYDDTTPDGVICVYLLQACDGYNHSEPAYAEVETTVEAETTSAGALVLSALTTQQLRGEMVNITYSLSARADVVVEVRNICGRLVKRLSCGRTASGVRTTSWDVRNLSGAPVPSGMYLCTVIARSDDGGEARAVRTVQLRR